MEVERCGCRDFWFLAPAIVLAAWGLVVLLVDLALARRKTASERRTLVGGLAMTLAIGIAAIVFAAFDIVMWSPLPLDEGDRVVAIQVWDREAGRRRDTTWQDLERWRASLHSVVNVGAFQTIQRNIITPDGSVQNEGDIGVPTKGPYDIAYGSLVPKAGQADNLLVPVCVSSSHIAFGSIRMEPVFMILGQSAATAACLAIDDHVAVQKVDYTKLRARILEDKQIIEWQAPAKAAKAPGKSPAGKDSASVEVGR